MIICYSREPKKICKRIWTFVIWEKSLQQIPKKIVGCCYKNINKCFKNCDQKVYDKAAEATVEFLGNKIAIKTVKPKPLSDEISGNVEEAIIPAEQREEISTN